MMGERLVMQESLFYEFRLEDHTRNFSTKSASFRPSCGSGWMRSPAGILSLSATAPSSRSTGSPTSWSTIDSALFNHTGRLLGTR
jgi:hypothetical protein